MKLRRAAMLSVFLTLVIGFSLAGQVQGAAKTPISPPPVRREFRGIWIATVNNGDWPSSPQLSSEEQKKELVAIMDRAVELNCNAIVFQVRPMCDAFYQSQIEPWSEYLTGEMGKPPAPFYDPLAFAVAQAHNRGLELHAWFNPYRVRASKKPASPNHVSHKHPELVRAYGKHLWLDPTEPGTREYSVSVIRDVVRRYDVDGVHFDDYFYPYQEKGTDDKNISFPDDGQWKFYKASGGLLSRDDWRRESVNSFIRMVQSMIKQEKPWVKYGISPFGIWQPGHPEGITGLNAYAVLYADSRAWLASGWVDYLAPQLYWPIDSKGQSFPVLLKWWAAQNPQHRHVWAGMSLGRQGGDSAAEVVAQIETIRKQPGVSGAILWHAKTIMGNRGGVADALAHNVYAHPALAPAYPWINSTIPAIPKLHVEKVGPAAKLNWQPGAGKIWLWVLQTKHGGSWTTRILPGDRSSEKVEAAGLESVALTAVNRYGTASAPVMANVK